MPVDYSMLSLKAINNILPFLRRGLIYTEATLLAKVPEVLGNELWNKNEEDIIQNIAKVIANNREEKKLLNITNNLISEFKALSNEDKFAVKDFNYIITNDDKKKINQACIDSFGEKTWKEKQDTEKESIKQIIEKEYQNFFGDKKREYKKLPHLLNTMKWYLIEKFDILKCEKPNDEKCNCKACKKINKLYHPSQIEIYPAAKEKYYEDVQKHLTLLGSPKTGAFKNPMAMRALYELRALTNYLIKTDQIDADTRIVVELARELNDSNKRWAYETYQRRRQEENKEFASAILELVKDPEAQGIKVNADSSDDIDKFRLWYEMIEGEEGYETKDKKFTKNEIEVKSKKNRKNEEEEYEVFQENSFERINKSLYFKLKKSKDDVIAKYRLWKEQNCQCMYTGKMIRITDLFKENVIDFEHTIPRSISFDNRLENLTVCFASYNRNIKKNQIPFHLPNYEEEALGYDAIKPRLKKWEQKVKDLELHIEFWKTKSKRATIKEDKDKAIRQKHLWQFELDYWRDKLNRFTMEEVKSSFKNSQLVDTQIISKYAFNYLKTAFNKVDVQKGTTTAEFRKIFGIQNIDEIKDRSKHSHHAKDAIVLTLIPIAAIREQLLKLWYEIKEKTILLYTENNKNEIAEEIKRLEEKLNKLLKECNLPNVNAIIGKIDEQILINNIAKDQTLTLGKRRIRSRGKVVGLKDENNKIIYKTDEQGNFIQRKDKKGNLVFKTDEKGKEIVDENGNKISVLIPKEKWATGDAIRGQLHLDSYYGAVKLIKKDDEGKFIKNEKGEFEFENIKYVIREELVFKKDENSPGFKTIEELQKCIVDLPLFNIIKKQVDLVGDFKEALKQGIWMFNKKGEKVNKIRRVRIVVRAKNPIQLKKQTYKSSKSLVYLENKKHKEFYWVDNAETPYFTMYKDGKTFEPETLSLFEVAERKNKSLFPVNELKDILETKKENGSELSFSLKKGQKIIFLKEPVESVKVIPEYYLNTLYKVEGFEEGGRMRLQHHLISKEPKEIKKDMELRSLPKEGATEIDFTNPIPLLRPRLYMIKNNKLVYNFAIEGKHFKVNLDGNIEWLIK